MLLGASLALLALLLSLFILIAAFAGIGMTLRRSFGIRTLRLDDCRVSFWVGYALTLFFLILWNFVLPVGLPALISVLAAGALGLCRSRRELATVFAESRWRPRGWHWVVLALAAAWVANQTMSRFESWDGVLYHVQAVKWAKAFPVVPGIANLHGPLAFNNSSFLYDAMVDSGWWEDRGFHLANAALILGAVLHSLLDGFRWLQQEHPSTARYCFGFVLLALAFHMANQIAGYSTDSPMALVLAAAITVMYGLLDSEESTTARSDDDRAYDLVVLAVLLSAAVAIKQSAIVLASVALPTAIVYWLSARRVGSPAAYRSIKWSMLIVVLFGGAWMARGIIMSGYPFFPVPFAALPVDWRAPIEHATLESAFIAHTESGFAWRLFSGSWIRLMLFRDVNAAAVPGIIVAVTSAAMWRSARRAHIAGRRTIWVLLPLLVAIAVWAFTVPSHRYVPALFWALAALGVAESQRLTWPALSATSRPWVRAGVTMVALSPLVTQPVVSAVNRGTNPLTAIGQHNLLSDTLLIVTSDHGEHLNDHGLYSHGNSLYRPVSHVPLVMRFPGRIPAGLRVRDVVSLKDIPRTILDLLASSDANPFPGRSLVPRDGGPQARLEPVLSEATKRPFGGVGGPLNDGSMKTIIADGYQYITSTDGSEELYNFDDDIEERVNLVQSSAHLAELKRLRQLLGERLSPAASK